MTIKNLSKLCIKVEHKMCKWLLGRAHTIYTCYVLRKSTSFDFWWFACALNSRLRWVFRFLFVDVDVVWKCCHQRPILRGAEHSRTVTVFIATRTTTWMCSSVNQFFFYWVPLMELNLALVTQFCSFCLPNFVSPSVVFYFSLITHVLVMMRTHRQFCLLFAVRPTRSSGNNFAKSRSGMRSIHSIMEWRLPTSPSAINTNNWNSI